MHELGNVQYAAQGMRTLKPPRNETPVPTQKTAITIANDDAAAAVIRNPGHTQDVHQDSQYTGPLFSISQSANREAQAQGILPTSDSSTLSVYSDPSELVTWLRDEIMAINSFDGFMLGVHDKIEKFTEHTEFGLEQILDVEQSIGELHETLELGKFSLKRITAEALKVLRCQGNLGPQRVLHLLRENVSKPKTTEQFIEEQATIVSEQNE
ncbi:hypothetical protein ACFL3Q_11760 [Planctomycetota bacterium]